MLFDAVTAVGVTGTDGTVVGALWRWETARRKAGRQLCIDIPQEVLLLETKPEIVVVIIDGRAAIGRMWRTIGIEHFTHDQVRIVAVWIWINGNGLEQAV